MYARKHTLIRLHIYINTYIFVFYMHICLHAYIYKYIHVYMHTYVHTYIRTYVYTYVYEVSCIAKTSATLSHKNTDHKLDNVYCFVLSGNPINNSYQ